MKKHATLKQIKDSCERIQLLSNNESESTNGGIRSSLLRPLYGIIIWPLYGIVPTEDLIQTQLLK
jgi:hypothetical protein